MDQTYQIKYLNQLRVKVAHLEAFDFDEAFTLVQLLEDAVLRLRRKQGFDPAQMLAYLPKGASATTRRLRDCNRQWRRLLEMLAHPSTKAQAEAIIADFGITVTRMGQSTVFTRSK